MKVLLDANVALTYLTGRDDQFSEAVNQIMLMCAKEKIEGAIAFHSLSIIWYQGRKLPENVRRDWIKQLCQLLTVSSADNEDLLNAVDDTDFKDFEDAMQDCCAVRFHADFIITANIKDYKGHSNTIPLTPNDFLKLIESL